MKIRQKARDKYAWYLGLCRPDEPRPLPAEKIPMAWDGHNAPRCFHVFESTGIMEPCMEPELLERYIQGKSWHGVTVEMVAECYFERLAFADEIHRDYPAWVAAEIFELATKIARKKLGFVPRFITESKDFTL